MQVPIHPCLFQFGCWMLISILLSPVPILVADPLTAPTTVLEHPSNLLFRQNAKTILSVPSSWINKILNKNKYSIAFGSKTMFDYPQLPADSPVRPSHDRSLCFSVHHYSMAVRSQAGPSDLGPWYRHNNDSDIKGNRLLNELWCRYPGHPAGHRGPPPL